MWTAQIRPTDSSQEPEFCAFVRERDELTDYGLYELVIDSVDPKAIATWRSTVLGAEIGGQEDHQWWWLEEVPGMPFEGWSLSSCQSRRR